MANMPRFGPVIDIRMPMDEVREEPPAINPFPLLMANAAHMCPPDDPLVTACLYRLTLKYIDPSEPLFGITYNGQTIGPLSPEEQVAKRWAQEVRAAEREDKQVGVLAALDIYGADAFEFELVESKQGRRSEMQAWADAGEKRMIAEGGGVLQSMTERLHQTLNLTKGGAGKARWEGLDALRMVAFERFRVAMEWYVEETGTSLVPTSYVMPSGHRLGAQLNAFRVGGMRIGLPKQKEIEAWAETLPGWAWHVSWATASEETKEKWRNSNKEAQNRPEVLEATRQRGKAQWENASAEKRKEWCNSLKEAANRPEVLEVSRQSGKAQWENASVEKRKEWCNSLKEAANRPEVLEASRQRNKAQWENASAEKRKEWSDAIKAAANRPEVREAHRQHAKAQWENASAEKRKEWCNSLNEAHNRPEVRAATSERLKVQWKNMSEEARAAISERVKAQRKRQMIEHPELEAARLAKQKATWEKRFEASLVGLTEKEIASKRLARESRARKSLKRTNDLIRLRTVMPNAKTTDLPRAREEGLIPDPPSDPPSE